MASYDILSKLKYNPDNPRIRNDEKQARIKKSISVFPDMLIERPIVYDENNIVLGGNGRLKALRELVNDGAVELKDEYVSQVTNWTEEQKRKFIIEDNKIESEWDYDKLVEDWDLGPLKEWGLDLTAWQEVESSNSPTSANKEVDVDSLINDSKSHVCPRCKFEIED